MQLLAFCAQRRSLVRRPSWAVQVIRHKAIPSLPQKVATLSFCFTKVPRNQPAIHTWLQELLLSPKAQDIQHHANVYLVGQQLATSERQRIARLLAKLASPANSSRRYFGTVLPRLFRTPRCKPRTACTCKAPGCQEALARVSWLRPPSVQNGARDAKPLRKASKAKLRAKNNTREDVQTDAGNVAMHVELPDCGTSCLVPPCNNMFQFGKVPQ